MPVYANASAFLKDIKVGLDLTAAETYSGREAHNLSHLEDYASRNFDHVRIRVPYDVNNNEEKDKFNRLVGGENLLRDIKTVVDNAITAGLIPIIAYHGGPLEEDLSMDNQDFLVHWWKTVATYFSSYSNSLAFNLIVEVSDALSSIDNVDILNSVYNRAIDVIRNDLKQTDRVILCAPCKLSEPRCLYAMRLPSSTEDPFIAAEWHDYAAGAVLYDNESVGKATEDGTLNISKLDLALEHDRYWNENPAVSSIQVRAENRQRIRDTIAVAKRWSSISGVPSWIGAWMANNFNKGVQENGDYSIDEQKVFANFCAKEFNKAGIPHAWNADKKYHELLQTGGTWINEFKPVIDAVVMPSQEHGFSEIIATESVSVSNTESRVTWPGTDATLLYNPQPTRVSKKNVEFGKLLISSGQQDPVVQVWYKLYSSTGMELGYPKKSPGVIKAEGGIFPETEFKYTDMAYLRIIAFGASGNTYVFEYERTNT